MDALTLISFIVTLSALLAFINIRFLKLPATIGVMVLSLVLSLVVILGGRASSLASFFGDVLHQLDFSKFILNFMLGFLLFAGALHTDIDKIKKFRKPIYTFASVGILISTFIIGTALYFIIPLVYEPVDYIHCLLFGALISPTDPIAVLSILHKAGISSSTEAKITGESLFNDGVGVVVFITLFDIATVGINNVSALDVSILLLKEIGGGVFFGLLIGYLGFIMLKKIDHYQTEVLITLALVFGGTALAPIIHYSAPLAMVLAGLIIGNKGVKEAMSEESGDYMLKFWEMVDEIMNAILFVLIGLELIIIPFELSFIVIGLIAALVILLARYLSLVIPSKIFHFGRKFNSATFFIMTWGGLRGGVSVALALSLTADMERNMIVAITYVVVLFSIVVQGLTLGGLVKKMNRRTTAGGLFKVKTITRAAP